jgi:hypothetical protein
MMMITNVEEMTRPKMRKVKVVRKRRKTNRKTRQCENGD